MCLLDLSMMDDCGCVQCVCLVDLSNCWVSVGVFSGCVSVKDMLRCVTVYNIYIYIIF